MSKKVKVPKESLRELVKSLSILRQDKLALIVANIIHGDDMIVDLEAWNELHYNSMGMIVDLYKKEA